MICKLYVRERHRQQLTTGGKSLPIEMEPGIVVCVDMYEGDCYVLSTPSVK